MTILPILLLALSPIQIDGSFHDWPKGITSQEDPFFYYSLIELPSEKCLQQLAEPQSIELGQYTIIFSPEKKGHGISCKKDGELVSPYEAGVVFAPTTAATKFEIRVNKKEKELPKKIFDLSPKGDFRVVSWNVQLGNLLEDKARSSRLLKALKPDVLLLQELSGGDTPEILTSFLTKTLGGTWQVTLTESTGTLRHHQLRSAIATSLHLQTSELIDSGSWRQLKAIFSTIECKKKPVNFISLHLRCCGGPTGEAEQQRQKEATAIQGFINSHQSPRFVIAGDLNLVGTTKPLEILQCDRFSVVNAYQPDGLQNATWSDSSSSFTPGRLDWMLYSPQSLEVINCFVLETSDLLPESLTPYNLLSKDTAELSDHLPLVADFKIIK